jgi:6-pyruvoyltetrahydropterin/6-carboxytetrahydropterin synthase
MSKWEIAKEFSCCYGHRVWSQSLDTEFSLDSCLACRHLHGHQGTIILYFESSSLKDGMVTDFKHTGWFKKWLDDTLDHKFIMDLNDPLLDNMLYPLLSICRKDELFEDNSDYHIIKPTKLLWYTTKENHLREKFEGMVFVDFVPTSENICKWIHDIVQRKMDKLGIKVSRVQFFETPKSQSNYYAQ